ncbi:hypothetical protein [Streptomyces acidicola]|uniref:Uncharacterized protein n=1 Tax=Streptomyces acidicola TaxID=2596892 RepID=A0A5N8X3C4_9ACTN|nr:hypothetical protein [Streptomyces acidicola]MPY54081.1 hypothetical protein [Streptomyces acidicola]
MPERKSGGRRKRAVVAIAASVGIVAAAATGVNYASASSSAPRSAPQNAAQSAAQSAGQSAGQSAPNVVGDAASTVPQGGDNRTNINRRENEGRILVNERTFAAEHGVCTAVISSQSANFNVRNESDKTVEFFSGITCDNGAPIAIIGPRSSSSAIPGTVVTGGGITAIVGSFRVIDNERR